MIFSLPKLELSEFGLLDLFELILCGKGEDEQLEITSAERDDFQSCESSFAR